MNSNTMWVAVCIILLCLGIQCVAKGSETVEYSQEAVKITGTRYKAYLIKVTDQTLMPDSAQFDFPEYIKYIRNGTALYCLVFCHKTDVKTVVYNCGELNKQTSELTPIYKMPDSQLVVPFCIDSDSPCTITLLNKKGKIISVINIGKLLNKSNILKPLLVSEEITQIDWDKLFNSSIWDNCK